jgi:hypothetical protein
MRGLWAAACGTAALLCAACEPSRPGEEASGRGGAATAAIPDEAAEPGVPDELRAIGYADWGEADTTAPVGAVVHAPDRVAPGWNVHTDDVATVLAVDRDGVEVRRWHVPDRRQVEYARVLEGGRVLALSVDEGLTLLEPNGAVVWALDLPCHHDVAVRPGDPPGARLFAVATHTARPYRGRSVRFDEVRFVAEATGREVATDERAPLDAYQLREPWSAPHRAAGRRHPLDTAADRATDSVYDYFHLNSLEWHVADDGREVLLLCLRNVDTVAEVDAGTGEVVWHAGPGLLDWPHMPRRLEDGAVLVFDNGRHRGWSRAVELGRDGRVRWSWPSRPSPRFFSDVRGAAQRLANGNTLLTESERGRALEVTRDGAVVWEYHNPVRRGAAVRRIYRMERYEEQAFPQGMRATPDPGLEHRGTQPGPR